MKILCQDRALFVCVVLPRTLFRLSSHPINAAPRYSSRVMWYKLMTWSKCRSFDGLDGQNAACWVAGGGGSSSDDTSSFWAGIGTNIPARLLPKHDIEHVLF